MYRLVSQGRDIIVGNVGDSRAVSCTRDKDDTLMAIQLTVDLKPNLPGTLFVSHLWVWRLSVWLLYACISVYISGFTSSCIKIYIKVCHHHNCLKIYVNTGMLN